MLLSYDTIEELIERAGLDLLQDSNNNADEDGEALKTNPDDQSRQSRPVDYDDR